MFGKKAFEIQFNWIFVLVAGAAILIFFTVVVVKQKSVSETSTQATVLGSMESIITGTTVSKDTVNIIDIPDSSIEISCNRVSIGKVSKQYQSLILFSPGLIRGTKIITQTSGFSAPYRSTNFLYMTSPKVRYIITGSSSLAAEINRSLPSDIEKEAYMLLPQIRNNNDDKVRFIAFGSMIEFPQALAKMKDSDVTLVKVSGDNEKGTLEFYQKNGNAWASKGTSVYIGKQSLIGAVYADTLESYECSMRNAFSRLKFVTRIYAERTQGLMQSSSGLQGQIRCSQMYNAALTNLNRILSASSRFDINSINTIWDSSRQLAEQNKNAEQLSCVLVY